MNNFEKYVYKIQEAAVYVVLKRIVFSSDQIFWDPPETPVDLDPDIIVGHSLFQPKAVFFISHGQAQNAQQIKYWRDLYEVFLYRKSYPQAKLIRVYFGKPASLKWEKALKNVFDSVINVQSLEKGMEITEFLNNFLKKLGLTTKKEVVATQLEPHISKKIFQPFINKLKTALNKVEHLNFDFSIIKQGKILNPIYPTSTKRFCILGGIFPEVLNNNFSKVTLKRLSETNLAHETMSGVEWVEPYNTYINSTFDLFEKKQIDNLIKKSIPFMREYRKRWANSKLYYNAFVKTYKLLKKQQNSTKYLYDLIKDQQKEIEFLRGLKYLTKMQGSDTFGHSLILQKSEIEPNTSNLSTISKLFKGKSAPKNMKIYETLVDFMFETAKQYTFDQKLKRKFLSNIFHTIFYDEAIKNRNMEVIPWFLNSIFTNNTFQIIPRLSSVIDKTGKIGTVRVLKTNKTIIHWKTAHRGHIDKAKELAAKGLALKLNHLEIEKFILILDGDFSFDNYKKMQISGWDYIVPFAFFNKKNKKNIKEFEEMLNSYNAP